MLVEARIRAFKLFSRLVSLNVVFVGFFVLVGWVFDITILKSIIPAITAMNPLTAVCFILSGISLWAYGVSKNGSEGAFKTIAKICAFLVFFIALINSARFLGFDFGIDQILFADKLKMYTPINRMAPNTNIGFLLIGISLLILKFQSPKGYRFCEFTTLGSFLISAFAFLGYFYRVEEFYGIASYIPMALNTAIGLNILVLGILCADPNRGLMRVVISDNVGGQMLRRLLLPVIIIPSVLFWVRLQGEAVFHYYDAEFGVSIMVMITIVIVTTIIWWNAHSLDKIDIQRKIQEEDLKKYRQRLEQMVKERTVALEISETRFRRLFEAAKDGILILNADTGKIAEVNPFLLELLGHTKNELLGKELWELGLFEDIVASKEAFLELQNKEYIRYENLPFRTKDGRQISVEFVSNVYMVNNRKVIQCNIRDISYRKRAEQALKEKMHDLERFSRFAVDRELKMEELEKEMKELRQRLEGKIK